MSLGICPRDKLYRGYIDLEIQLREFDRCRILYEKFLEFGSENCTTWMKVCKVKRFVVYYNFSNCSVFIEIFFWQFAELETLLGDIERARAIYELAISQPR